MFYARVWDETFGVVVEVCTEVVVVVVEGGTGVVVVVDVGQSFVDIGAWVWGRCNTRHVAHTLVWSWPPGFPL